MLDPRALAAVNLHAVLRDLEDLVALDPQAAAIVADRRIRVTFRVPGVTPLSLTFTDGRCRAATAPGPLPEKHRAISLTFTTPGHFNALIAGTGMPIPLRGIRHLSFVKQDFTALTTRLETLLRSTPETNLTDSERHLATTLTTYVAFHALAQIATHDRLGRANAARMADGDIAIDVAGGTGVTIHVYRGTLQVAHGVDDTARARMWFDSAHTIGEILAGRLDSYAALGDERLAVSGYIPLLDHLNKLLALTARYLA
ncbi:hypothetical protein KEM60_00492 [Austwickia sp. TVS 96-490-7B]|uniref:hypothetical protein n=1 Tax=Austwickia sp. TVS 96-490-7B TaxID=2830843 RepID=UPI001C599749|nr:hypothetical protein [Austwickia sp. TVS 96-490-7B]MBW3084305.1 hypothetical protein [Austwickia sp. TVS 96-490-7B]